jgi:hypothetical protein
MAHASILCARMLPHAQGAINRGDELFTMRSIGALESRGIVSRIPSIARACAELLMRRPRGHDRFEFLNHRRLAWRHRFHTGASRAFAWGGLKPTLGGGGTRQWGQVRVESSLP